MYIKIVISQQVSRGVKETMIMTKLRFLRATTVAGQRHAKGDEVKMDEVTAQNLVALGKAEILKEKKSAREIHPAPSITSKPEHKT